MSPTPGTHSGQIDALRPTTQPGTGIHTAPETFDSESIVLARGSWKACQRLWNVLIPGLACTSLWLFSALVKSHRSPGGVLCFLLVLLLHWGQGST